MMCASRLGAETCDGDSGSPAMLHTQDGKRIQVGIVSWGAAVECSSIGSGMATVLTRISAFREWILENIKEHGIMRGQPVTQATLIPSPSPPSPAPPPPPSPLPTTTRTLLPKQELSQKDALEAFKKATGYVGSVCGNWTDGTCYKIDLDYKSLVGTLVPELSVLTDLRHFDVWQNGLQGSLPVSYSTWVNLETVMLSFNSLTGTLPPNYSEWVHLKFAYFRDNKFKGRLPPQYSAWKQIDRVIFDNNSLTGNLPPQYSEWTKATTTSFSYNRLTGSVPVEYTRVSTIWAQFQGGTELCVSNQVQSLVAKGDLDKLPRC
eukprot:TRINITY_DN2595_c0_g1_i11.p1 TRINITY_DN2595_c0_g1~~TRINITY_DN2595_c0_g1_i11.p1  ORF type:complete len:319 (+),score=15.78 TRINITY_DN2595_c0_g1_i11:344-1300(+)